VVPCLTKNVDALIVDASISLLKETVIELFRAMPVALLTGLVALTVEVFGLGSLLLLLQPKIKTAHAIANTGIRVFVFIIVFGLESRAVTSM
jgi:hypothetical protein